MTDGNDGGFVITGEARIKVAGLSALRGVLRLETRGLKRHGRSARAIANEVMGTNYRTAKAAYGPFDAYLVKNYADYGVTSWPLEPKKEGPE